MTASVRGWAPEPGFRFMRETRAGMRIRCESSPSRADGSGVGANLRKPPHPASDGRRPRNRMGKLGAFSRMSAGRRVGLGICRNCSRTWAVLPCLHGRSEEIVLFRCATVMETCRRTADGRGGSSQGIHANDCFSGSRGAVRFAERSPRRTRRRLSLEGARIKFHIASHSRTEQRSCRPSPLFSIRPSG